MVNHVFKDLDDQICALSLKYAEDIVQCWSLVRVKRSSSACPSEEDNDEKRPTPEPSQSRTLSLVR